MKSIIFITFVSLTTATLLSETEWRNYKDDFNKKYYSPAAERKARLNVQYNKLYVNLHNTRANSGLVSYRLALNQFSDMTKIEFFEMIAGKRYYVNEPPPKRIETPVVLRKYANAGKLPEYRNWTQDGAGYEVFDQGTNCNAAWAFSALESAEAHYFQVFGKLPPKLSPQNLIDCAGLGRACDGYQIPETVYKYIEFQMNVNTWEGYPYTGNVSFCKYNPNDIGIPIGGYQTINDNDDDSLLNIVAWECPVVVGFNPFSFEFMHYSSGIFVPPYSPIKFYHKYFVTVIGYGIEDRRPYWIIKNSMGNTWGQDGYMKVERNGQYKLAQHASFPNV